MFGSLQFLAFLNFLLFLTPSLSICPFHVNLEWRKGLCGTKAKIGKCWEWVGLWESVVLCMHMVSDCCTFWIPQLLTHLSLPGKCRINSQCQAVFWLLAVQLHLVPAVCLLQNDWVPQVLAFLPIPSFPPLLGTCHTALFIIYSF